MRSASTDNVEGILGDTATLSTLTRGIRAVEALSSGPLSVVQLARVLGCHRQAAYRVLATLEAAQWVQRRGDRYALTTRPWSVGVRSIAGIDQIRRDVSGHLRVLASRFGETAHLAVYDAGEAVHIDRAEGSYALVASSPIGQRGPAYTVAPGKVLLAFGPPEERDRLLRGPLTSFTTETLSDPAALAAELATVAERGYAVNRGEHVEGLGGVAVPLRAVDGTVPAAVGFSGPAERLVARVDELVAGLREATDAVYERMLVS
ncbi:MAG: IclR family transcriptional regulator [Acidimicrobiales bacterium]|nr:IclR family transcriptional regulator [Acidimicrobiales bacterium]